MKILAYLKKYGITQTHFAKKLGISFSGLQYIVHGKTKPGLALAAKIIKESDGEITMEDLLKEKPQKKVKNKI